jgi:hypothetical protein
MRTFSKISLLLLFLLSACNLPETGQPAPDPTVPSDAQPALVTETPTQEITSTECAFVWAREPLPDLSGEFDAALKEALPEASGYAEAYGENCINAQGEVVRFLAMETDYYVTLQ